MCDLAFKLGKTSTSLLRHAKLLLRQHKTVLGFDCPIALLTHAKIRGNEAPGLFVWAVYNPCHAKT